MVALMTVSGLDGIAQNSLTGVIDPADLPHWPVLTKSKVLSVLLFPFREMRWPLSLTQRKFSGVWAYNPDVAKILGSLSRLFTAGFQQPKILNVLFCPFSERTPIFRTDHAEWRSDPVTDLGNLLGFGLTPPIPMKL